MPTVRKLSIEEVEAFNNKGKGTRRLVEEEYDRLLSDFTAGEYGEVEPDEGDKRLTVRNRLKAAAQRANMQLVFSRMRGDVVRFKVVGSDQPMQEEMETVVIEAEAQPEPEPVSIATDTPLPKKRGRKKKES